jgi:hypothetical protein
VQPVVLLFCVLGQEARPGGVLRGSMLAGTLNQQLVVAHAPTATQLANPALQLHLPAVAASNVPLRLQS